MGLEPNAAADIPKIAPTAYVHQTATLIGNVVVEGKAFVGPDAVLRADELGADGTVWPVVVCEGANVQDCVVVHALGGTGVRIGPTSSVAHAAVIHGPCEIGADCFVGFGSVVFNATLVRGVIVMHHALVEGVTIPPGHCVPSMTSVRCAEELLTRESQP
jgi:carbonic anhydrase/acetyltransferase-like protein (isoleucine patch superfamily)